MHIFRVNVKIHLACLSDGSLCDVRARERGQGDSKLYVFNLRNRRMEEFYV